MDGWHDRGGEAELEPPGGTVTFLMTDVEGSTAAREADMEVTGPVMSRLVQLVGEVMERHGGFRPVEQGETDSAVWVFGLPSAAVAAALDAHRALAAEPWPGRTGVAARMAMHTGEAYQPDPGQYEGPAVIRCARIRAAGHGGQVLVSDVTGALLSGRLPPGSSLIEIGAVRLIGQSRPERLWQLAHPDLRAAFPPLRALEQAPTNLPHPLSSFVGRASELTELAGLLAAHRLVTLTGSGGCGKTRLALEAAQALAPGRPGGVWWTELARVGSDAEVAGALAAVLGLETYDGQNPGRAVARQLAEAAGPVLVVLDNCEHVVSAAATLIDELLAAVAEVTVVATSREPLGVAGEVTWRVPSLRLPEAGDNPSKSDDVRLFCERARSARPNLALDLAQLAQVAQICRRLDGIPLALELAAARTRTMSLGQIGSSLDHAFRLLVGGPRTVLARQQTIHASIDWSVDLLDEADRVVLRRLAVCTASFDLDAAEVVASDDQIASWDVLDNLDRLVDKSMVQLDDDGRYRLLEMVRQHGFERLRTAGELAAVRDRHADHYLRLAARLAPLGSGDEREFACISSDFANIEAAREWRLASDRPGLALEAMAALHHHPLALPNWHQRVAALDRPVPDEDRLVWARAVATMTAEAPWRGIAVGDLPQRAHDLAVAAGDRWASLLCRFGPAISQAFTGDLDPMREVVETVRVAGFDDILIRALQSLGAVENMLWRFNDADVRFAEVIDLAERLDNRFMASIASGQRALTAARLGRLDDAEMWARAQNDLLIATAGLPVLVLCEIAQARADVALADTVLDGVSSLPDDWFGFTDEMAVRRDLIAGDFTTAITRIEALPEWAVGDARRLEAALELAGCRRELGQLELARRQLQRASAIVEHLGNPYPLARVALMSAAVAAASGDVPAARSEAHTALSISVSEGLPLQSIEALEQLAIVAERPLDTARLAAAATSARDRLGYRWRWPTDDRALAEALAAARDAMGQAGFVEATAAGAGCSLPDAADLAARARGRRGRPTSGWEALTPTEAQVVGLVARGCTNQQIGGQLLMGQATVRTHLNHVYVKVGVPNRAALAASVARRATRAEAGQPPSAPPR